MNTLGQRLKEERERLGMTQAAFGALAGIQKNAQVNYEAGRRSPDGSYFSAIAGAGVDVLYVLTGRREDGIARMMSEADGSALLARELAKASVAGFEHLGGDIVESTALKAVTTDFAPIPVYAAELAAGTGTEIRDDAVVEYLAFHRSWLKRLGVAASNAVMAHARGDSMWPTIHAGDVVLIDRQAGRPMTARDPSDRRPVPIFALRDDAGARIKRVTLAASGTLALLSDNPAVPPEFRKPEDVSIIGRVRWWGHTDL